MSRWLMVCAAFRSRIARAGVWRLPSVLLALLLLAGSAPALAADLVRCRELRQLRDQGAAAAIEQELALVRLYRQRRCPALARQAETANAEQQRYGPIDYEALLRCRREAEQALEHGEVLLYRNSLGFSFYTPQGAQFARQADAWRQQLQSLNCP